MKQRTTYSPFKGIFAERGAASAVVALAMVATLALGAIAPAFADAKSSAAGAELTEDQMIVHLLNRIGFGPRPGDVERVKQIGIDKYIDQQLNPERLDDSATEARLKNLSSLRMPIAEIYEKYPAPNKLAQELGLGKKGFNQQAKPDGPAAPNAQDRPEPKANDLAAELGKKENRQKIFAYYREHGLKLPQMLLQELMEQKILRAVYSERQLQEVMTDFWFNHFNIFYGKGADRWLTTDYEMHAIRPHTLGKFEDLLMATAKSPAMLFYLDNFQSSSPDAKLPERRGNGRQSRFQRRQGTLGGGSNNPRFGNNEQRRMARETERDQAGDDQQMRREMPLRAQAAQQFRKRRPGINENYARELMELHTLGVEGGYTQKDVQEVARCFTGWTINQPRRSGEFIFREWMHDDGEKVVLGHKIPAGGGKKDGEMVLDILANHPNTAKFISMKLARRFVSDNPPQALVDRVAGIYMKTGGDIREMLRAIFTSPEFKSKEAYRAKIKSPFELSVSAIRALGGDTMSTQQVAQFISRMGQPLYRYQPPTGFPDRAEQWVNTGSLLERLNFGLALSTNRLRGTTVDLKRVAPGIQGGDTRRALDRAIALLLNDDVSQQTRAILNKQLRGALPVTGELDGSSRAAMKSDSVKSDSMDDGDSLLADDAMETRRAKGDKVAKLNDPGRRARRMGIGYDAGMQTTISANDSDIAKVFGLVLGSPEFQRR